GSKLAQAMQEISIETQKQLGEMNHTYKTDMEMKEAVANIIGEDIPDTVRIRQPFYMDFGKNIHFGENVFVNASVHMQDQGEIGRASCRERVTTAAAAAWVTDREGT